MENTTVTMSVDNMRKIINTFRSIKPAPQSITIKPEIVQITDPRGKLVVTAVKVANEWQVTAPAGLLKAVK